VLLKSRVALAISAAYLQAPQIYEQLYIDDITPSTHKMRNNAGIGIGDGNRKDILPNSAICMKMKMFCHFAFNDLKFLSHAFFASFPCLYLPLKAASRITSSNGPLKKLHLICINSSTTSSASKIECV